MQGRSDPIPEKAVSFRRRARRWFFHRAIRMLTLVHDIALTLAGIVGASPPDRQAGEGVDIVVTGRFDSDNWILSHLGPLSASAQCKTLYMVSTRTVPELPGVIGVYPPRWMQRILGVTPARLLTFVWTSIRRRPHIVGGFHLLVNGMAAAVTGRLVGARAMYFCVGGPVEVLDGGVWGEGNHFAKMETPDPVVERRLLRTVAACDLVITMGTRAVTFFQDKGIRTNFHVVSGGIDDIRFAPDDVAPSYDAILTGRLVEIKRIDVFLEAIKLLADRLPTVRVVFVGSGPLREQLACQAAELGITECVHFAGHQQDVERWLRMAKVFVLSSDSEGLSLSLMEAMMTGLPAVVSNVGDLADLVEDGVNGFLVPRRCPEAFADSLEALLTDEQKLATFSVAAHEAAMRHKVSNTVARWDGILAPSDAAKDSLQT